MDDSIGKNIKAARERLGVSQIGLSKMANLCPTLLSHLESGRRNPSLQTLKKVACALGVSMEVFFEPDSIVHEQRIARLFQRLNKRDQHIIRNLMDVMLND